MYVSDALVKRLPAYLRYLDLLLDRGVYRISSTELGKIMGLTPSQVRQDINTFGGMGRQGYGYPVIDLKKHIEDVVGVNKTQNMIIIGAGNIGSALANYNGFKESGFKTIALFDVDSKKIGKKISGIPILDLKMMDNIVKNNDINIAILCCPLGMAQELCELAYNTGIRGFWNFAPLDLKIPDDAVCVNVSLSETLQQLSFRLKKLEND